MNLGFKIRTIIVLCEIAIRIIKIIYHIIMLAIQLIIMIPMMFSQKTYNTLIDDLAKKDIQQMLSK